MNIKSHSVYVPLDDGEILGDLNIPQGATALVLFAHGSGSGRHSPRNRFVAEVLNEAGIATLLIDLLTTANIDLLADRLSAITNWMRTQTATERLHMGYFGASTGAAAALVAAAKHPQNVEAIVSRGGRPDLAGRRLAAVHAPTLLIVGSNDPIVIELNRQAASELRGDYRLEIVPGAGHLFEEPGTLELVAELAREWFEDHLILSHRRAA